MWKRFVHRNSLNVERSKKETPEAQAFDNATIMDARPNEVNTKPKIRVEFRAIMIFRTVLDNNPTLSSLLGILFKLRKARHPTAHRSRYIWFLKVRKIYVMLKEC